MDMKPTNAYKHLRVYYITNIVSLLHVHVSATLVAILREVSYKGHITITLRTNTQMQNGLKYIFKCKIDVKFVLK
jgi:hypothetical protein